MTDESRINEALAGHRDAEDRRRREVEELAERLYLAAYGGFWSLTEAETTVAGAPSLSATFAIAEDFITYRDERREQVKR